MKPLPPKPKKLLDLPRGAIRLKHFSQSTEKTYIQWAKRLVLYYHKRQRAEMGVPAKMELNVRLLALRARPAQRERTPPPS